MNILPIIASFLLLIGSVVLARQIHVHSEQNQLNKFNYAELNHAKYGIFSVNAWKDQLLDVAKAEFEKLYVSRQTEAEMREHISAIMTKLIDEVAKKVEAENQKSTSGKIKQLFINMFVDIEKLKKGVPDYTNAVIQELKKPKTQTQIRTTVINQFEDFAARSTDVRDQKNLQKAIRSIGAKDLASARAKASVQIIRMQNAVAKESVALILLTVGSFLIFVMNRKKQNTLLFLSLLLSLTLLLGVGTSTPMIDIEAKISELKFLLIGHPISFENQIFYFQSKSILDVFLIMIKDPKINMKAVGVLVVTFSIFFPVIKLFSSFLYYFNIKNLKNNRVIKFFVLKSGKWSMADVMVVAIFMSYIGFNGVIGSQLNDLSANAGGMNIITTNGTSLQPGFYLFLAFVMIAMMLSHVLANGHAKLDHFTSGILV